MGRTTIRYRSLVERFHCRFGALSVLFAKLFLNFTSSPTAKKISKIFRANTAMRLAPAACRRPASQRSAPCWGSGTSWAGYMERSRYSTRTETTSGATCSTASGQPRVLLADWESGSWVGGGEEEFERPTGCRPPPPSST
jgi:hypothetical protein